MIIVSQEKTYLVNFNNICQVSLAVDKEETEYAIAVQTVDKEEIIMGAYKTEERAKEVLQEIIKSYRYYRTAECDGYTNVLEETAVFEMPKE